MNKKIAALITGAILLAGLTGCGSDPTFDQAMANCVAFDISLGSSVDEAKAICEKMISSGFYSKEDFIDFYYKMD